METKSTFDQTDLIKSIFLRRESKLLDGLHRSQQTATNLVAKTKIAKLTDQQEKATQIW